jgi:high affinity sulfate transporter 1
MAWLRQDLVAGLVVTALLVPAGMGYAQASGLPPILGLYATIVPLVVYATLGPSRIMVLGPDSSLAPMIAVVVVALAPAGGAEAESAAAMLAIITGGLLLIAGLARFGRLTDLLSKPVRYGYLNGIALTILVSQAPKLFGFSVDADGLVQEAAAFVEGVIDGETVPAAVAIGGTSVAMMLLLRRRIRRVPWTLVCVVGATVAAWLLGLDERGVSVVGPLPEGLPSFSVPRVEVSDVWTLLGAATGIALVAFADTSVLSRTLAARDHAEVNPDQEMVAVGMANVATGLFNGFPISSSSSRTPVAFDAGARTQLTGIVGALAIVVLLLFGSGLTTYLPNTVLAAVVIVAAISLIEVRKVRGLYRARRSEFILSMLAFLAVALFGVLVGIGIAVGLSLLNLVRRAWYPYSAVLGRVHGLKGYHDVTRRTQAEPLDGLVLFRFDAPLFFANANVFRDRVRELVDRTEPPARWVVVAAEPMTDIDSTAADMLAGLVEELREQEVTLVMAELKDPVRDRLVGFKVMPVLGEENLYPTIGTAVHAYRAAFGIPEPEDED